MSSTISTILAKLSSTIADVMLLRNDLIAESLYRLLLRYCADNRQHILTHTMRSIVATMPIMLADLGKKVCLFPL